MNPQSIRDLQRQLLTIKIASSVAIVALLAISIALVMTLAVERTTATHNSFEVAGK